ncbi:MAG: 8-oxo-dGTP diphosphatase [Akkermansiaceae bacterium]|jgi:8-oxo-dGTP diphosphatase|nr:8-oxo-dGTP diphosphatase [Roseibacillus sp.]|tara:strand:- start:23 stop:547 length:525 start_codon:yes stop_codon:yes gene_type:complete
MSEEADEDQNPPPIDWECWHPEIRATLMFIRDGEDVLLIKKLRGIGAGKVNAPGGKIDPGETPLEAAIRETQEEVMVTPLNPRKMGELSFAMTDIPDIFVHVYVASGCEGTPTETEEAIPMWTPRYKIPYDLMWEDDQYWLPRMMEGERFCGRFYFEGERIQWMKIDWGVDYFG